MEKFKYAETEEFLSNPRDFISSKNASLLEMSSLDKKQKSSVPASTVMAEPDYEKLDNKEKQLCSELALLPNDYLQLKQLIGTEKAKNKAISQSFVGEKAKDIN